MIQLKAAILVAFVASLATARMSAQGARPDVDDFSPLGGLGCEGEMTADARGRRVFRIGHLEDGGPAAKGGLVAGDEIVSLNGKPVPAKGDAVLAFARQVEAAEARKDGRLDAVLLRDGKKITKVLTVETLGAHADTCPVKCRKCATLRQRAAKFLVQTQSGTGGWETRLGGNNGLIVVTTLAGLALHGTRKHRREVSRAVDYVIRTCGAPSPFDGLRGSNGANWSQVNWPLAYAPFLLTAFRQNKSARNELKEIAHKLIANQEGSGGYAHGPGGPNALNYVELEIVSNYALASLGLMRDAGIPLDEQGVDRGLGYIQSCTSGDGGVAYSTRKGQAGHGDPGRTAGAYFALWRHGLGHTKAARKMLKFFERNMEKLPSGHVSPMMHMLAGAMVCRSASQTKLTRTYWHHYRDYIMSSRLHAGGFTSRPTRESQVLKSNTDRTLGPTWTTATYLIIMNIMMDDKVYSHLFQAPRKRPGA